MFRRFVMIALALVVGLGACSKPPRERRAVKASFRACEGIAKCNDTQAKIYREAFEKNEPVVELVTMGIGELIWERHGHIALCIRYRNPAEDICYNYGIGNFQQPLGMAWGFFRGTNSFWAGEQDIELLIRTYVGADRTVWAQPIPLNLDQKQQVIAKLYADTAPGDSARARVRPPGENLYYAYDHFWDNCTTRVRDILDAASNKALSSMTEPTDGRTFRDLARDGFYGMRVPLLITDIAMGRVTDHVPTYWERMFLPQYLREAVAKKWGIEPVLLYERHAGADERTDGNSNDIPDIHEDADGNGIPNFEEDTDRNSGRVLFALFIIALTAPVVLTRWLGRFQRTALAFAIVPYVLLGSILWFLAIISPLPYVQWNESLLVFLPLDLALMIGKPERRKLYARIRVVMLLAMGLLALVNVVRQPLLAPLLWPLIPAAVVGFWRPEWSRKRADKPAPERAKR